MRLSTRVQIAVASPSSSPSARNLKSLGRTIAQSRCWSYFCLTAASQRIYLLNRRILSSPESTGTPNAHANRTLAQPFTDRSAFELFISTKRRRLNSAARRNGFVRRAAAGSERWCACVRRTLDVRPPRARTIGFSAFHVHARVLVAACRTNVPRTRPKESVWQRWPEDASAAHSKRCEIKRINASVGWKKSTESGV